MARKARMYHVPMESTASFWKPIYNLLESAEFNVFVVNAKHMKNVPGRKIDVKDAEWIAGLLRHGLLQASYIDYLDEEIARIDEVDPRACGVAKAQIIARNANEGRSPRMRGSPPISAASCFFPRSIPAHAG